MTRLFLCGDVMTGRGIDQVLSHPVRPGIFEPSARSALEYVALAEAKNGPIPRSVDDAYIWGDALEAFERLRPEIRIINLETSVTRSEDRIPKGINYRMSPDNVACLRAASIDCCALANNHVLDWGYAGLEETLETLSTANIHTAGAGKDAEAARAPAIIDLSGVGRVIVFAFGCVSSGIPKNWAAGNAKAGINLLSDLSSATVDRIAGWVREVWIPGDVVVASVHWGGNWGYEVPASYREFARGLIDKAGVDVIHGHSSHHVKGIEVHDGKAILYGCGDFLNDYEGIGGYEAFRDDLTLMYFLDIDPCRGRLDRLQMVPLHIRNFRLNRASPADATWLGEVLDREGRRFGTRVGTVEHGTLSLSWQRNP